MIKNIPCGKDKREVKVLLWLIDLLSSCFLTFWWRWREHYCSEPQRDIHVTLIICCLTFLRLSWHQASNHNNNIQEDSTTPGFQMIPSTSDLHLYCCHPSPVQVRPAQDRLKAFNCGLTWHWKSQYLGREGREGWVWSLFNPRCKELTLPCLASLLSPGLIC